MTINFGKNVSEFFFKNNPLKASIGHITFLITNKYNKILEGFPFKFTLNCFAILTSFKESRMKEIDMQRRVFYS
jgi:hypothetical protein